MNAHGWSWVDRNAIPAGPGPSGRTATASPASSNDAALKNGQDEMNRLGSKLTEICKKPEYAVIAEKVPCDHNAMTFAQMADSTKVTDGQKALLMKYWAEVDPVWAAVTAAIRSTNQRTYMKIADLRDEFVLQSNRLRLELINRKITWGEFATRRKEMSSELVKKINSAWSMK